MEGLEPLHAPICYMWLAGTSVPACRLHTAVQCGALPESIVPLFLSASHTLIILVTTLLLTGADLLPVAQSGGYDGLRSHLRRLAVEAYEKKMTLVEEYENGLMQEAQRYFVLTQTDALWKEHLQVRGCSYCWLWSMVSKCSRVWLGWMCRTPLH